MTVVATSLAELPGQLAQIFYSVVLPILLLAGIGYVLQRRMGLDMTTLRRLNFYFVMPAMVYYAVVSSELKAKDVLTVAAVALTCVAVMAVVTLIAARLRGVPRDMRRTMLMTTLMHNSGNYGLPLQGLAFSRQNLSDTAQAYQTFVMITQNLFTFTVGILLAAGGKKDRHWKENLFHIVKFPPVYALAAALITIQIRIWLGGDAPGVAEGLKPLWAVVTTVKNAFIAVALLTLGAQLATVSREAHNYPVKLSVFLRLLGGPAIGLGVIYFMRMTGLMAIDGLLAQVLLIAMSTPTAVNCMLLCLEFDNHPDYAARAVFYSTLLSPVTVTLTIFVAQGNFLPGF